MTIQDDGRFHGDSAEELLTVLMNNARATFGDDLNTSEEAVIRMVYIPVANLLANIQTDLALVLDSAQLDFAEGMALDLLTALIGVNRKPATNATGTATFSRQSAASVDYLIPKGTVIQTDAIDPVKFETSEKATLLAGETSIADVPIQAVTAGQDGNVGANTITVMPNPPAGIETATNPAQTTSGTDQEDDEDLRARAKSELSDGMRGTARAIRNELRKMDEVKSVSMFINDDDTTDGDGLKPHHTEAVVEGGADLDVGQTIFDTKAAGDGTQGGVHGTGVTVDAEIGNDQTHPVSFSRATEVLIYVDTDLVTTDEYEGDDEVRDAIVRYIGGTIASGDTEDGTLRVSDDVIYTKMLSAILSVDGIEDVPSLAIGISASPTGTSNLVMDATQVATSDATDGSITITEV